MFVKDSTGLVINTDEAHYKSILARRQQRKSLTNLETQIQDLNSELSEIKSLLKDLLDGKKYG